MQVKLDVKPRDFQKIPEKMRKKLQAKYESALFRVAQIGISIITDRTARGVGYKGGTFKPYTEKYAVFRAKKGRDTRPNLFYSGNMLGSIISRADSKQAEIFFSKATESAKASGNNKKRPFFGFNRDEKKRLSRAFERFIK